ncbi:MAG: hypothetical protein IK125_03325 [Lachnospiraceae bacterium]|nr:hypothetical protein [Lachnospiraceae bacterium]
MRPGKVPYNTFIRSIDKTITPRQPFVLRGVGMGHDCSAFDVSQDGALVVSQTLCLHVDRALKEEAWLAVDFYRSVNDLCCAGAQPLALTATVLLPETWSEEDFRKIVTQLERLCEQEAMEYAGGDTKIVPADATAKPVITLTVYGTRDLWTEPRTNYSKDARKASQGYFKPKGGESLLMAGYAGDTGLALASLHGDEKLARRYSKAVLDAARACLKDLSAARAAAVARRHGITAMHNISSDGVFGALWEMADGAGLGLTADLRAIPVLQQTIELSDYLELNPYRLEACASLLMACDPAEADAVVFELGALGVPAACIGRFHTADEPIARILKNEDEERYIDRPGGDELQAFLARN